MYPATFSGGRAGATSSDASVAAPDYAQDAVSILDELQQVVFHTDRAGNWTFLNRAWSALTGLEIDATLGAFCLDRVHPDDRAHEQQCLEQLLSHGHHQCRHEVRYVRVDGEIRWVDVFARSSLGPDGTVNGTVGTLFDVSERKALQQQRRLADGVFGSAGEGIIVTSAAGSIVDVNASFETITGYTRAEVLGKNPRLLSSGRQDKSFYVEMWRTLAESGHWSGEVWNRRKCGEFYMERLTITAIHDDDGKLSHHVGVFSDLTHQKLQAEHLDRMNHYDALTGLPNRRLLSDRLQQAMQRARRGGNGVAVACLDLDEFKTVNELHGHGCGDELLVAVAHRMQEAVRKGDTVARLGGDEFVVVFDEVESLDACRPMVARLLKAVAAPLAVEGASSGVSASASAGVAFYRRDEDMDADQLIRQADQAMYEAKTQGKNRYCVFDSLGYRVLVDRFEELDAIEGALARGEFALHYQPIVHLRSGALNSVEALVRWNHPERGCLAPGAFLPVLEGHPLMLALENWILEEALRQHVRWLDAGLDVAVSVNMSGAQLRRKDFVAYLRALLAAHPRVDPCRLKLEVLETSALEDMEHVSNLITQCTEIGVSFALDDFGTGYSSLRYLKQLPAKRIKIDQGFVRDMLHDPDDLAILEGVVGLAAAFKRDVVAEGVETLEHAAMLVQLGCLLAQGYGIARPMPPEALASWLADWRLPATVAARSTLERHDILLLRALVEQRACPQGGTAGVAAFDEWLALDSPRRTRCEELVRRAVACRAALLAPAAPSEPAGAAFSGALARLVDA